LDEILDFGYPQTTETKILKEFIKTETNKAKDAIKMEITKTLTNVVNWRADGIKYKKNEAFLDVIEKVDCLIAANGDVLHSQILGTVKMKCNLTGMPNVALGLNDKVLFDMKGKKDFNRTVDLDDMKFHQCVDMNKFGVDRSIDFVPPDGEFELMSYRLDMQVNNILIPS
jgi:AP-1 complex subunit mu